LKAEQSRKNSRTPLSDKSALMSGTSAVTKAFVPLRGRGKQRPYENKAQTGEPVPRKTRSFAALRMTE
jgi:hypothetical protein